MKAFTLRILLSFIGVYLLLLILMFFAQRSLMYFPQPALSAEVAKTILPEAQIVEVVTADGIHLNAYFVPPKDARQPIILAFHGNGSLGLYLASNFTKTLEKGYGLLLAEYRGYGGNQGEPTEAGLYHDADAYLAFLKSHYNTNIIAYGQSLGSGVAVDLVARHPQSFIGLVLEVPFDSALNVSDKHYPYILFKEWILHDQYFSDQKIGAIAVPKLFLLAGQDEVVGIEGGLKLLEAAKEPKSVKVYDNAGHMNVFEYGAEKDLIAFLEGLAK